MGTQAQKKALTGEPPGQATLYIQHCGFPQGVNSRKRVLAFESETFFF